MRGIAIVVIAGCGRIGFDPTGGAGDDGGLPTGRWAHVSVGNGATCALTVTGELWCWGNNYEGEAGNGAITESAPPARIGGDTWKRAELESPGRVTALSVAGSRLLARFDHKRHVPPFALLAAVIIPAALICGSIAASMLTHSLSTAKT